MDIHHSYAWLLPAARLATSLRHLMEGNPGLTGEEIVAMYASRVAPGSQGRTTGAYSNLPMNSASQ